MTLHIQSIKFRIKSVLLIFFYVIFLVSFSDLHCCDKSSNADCRLACRNILRTQTIGQEIVDNLIEGGCGLPMPHVSNTLFESYNFHFH